MNESSECESTWQREKIRKSDEARGTLLKNLSIERGKGERKGREERERGKGERRENFSIPCPIRILDTMNSNLEPGFQSP